MAIKSFNVPIEDVAVRRQDAILELERATEQLRNAAKREHANGETIPAIAIKAGVTKKTMYEWLR
jgi:hypothetical protein